MRAPRLVNREAILEEREAISERLLAQGDSLLIKVHIYVDEQGIPRQPEIKQEIADRRIHDAAIALVRKMRFQPATEDGRPTPVMLTIPVKLVRR